MTFFYDHIFRNFVVMTWKLDLLENEPETVCVDAEVNGGADEM